MALTQTTIHVPQEQPTIQAAIDATVSGDTVLVSPGTYNERIDFKGKNITVTSSAGSANTIIDGSNAGSVVTFQSGESNTAVLSGFTIQNGNAASGGGILIGWSSDPTIEYNDISNNSCGEGISITSSSPAVRFNTIHDNNKGPGCSHGYGGGGISVFGASAAQIKYNQIYRNTATVYGGGVLLSNTYHALVEGNIIRNNIASLSQGGGIKLVNEKTDNVRDNVIVNNQGGGLSTDKIPGSFTNNTVAFNSSDLVSAEVSASNWNGNFYNNLIVAAPGGTAVKCDSTTIGTGFTYNDVFANAGTVYTCAAPTGTNHNISADPLFADAQSGNFHVATGSPVIDTGDPATILYYLTDAAADPRVVNGVIDIGAFEYQGETTFTATPSELAFGSQKRNTFSAAQNVLVTNTGTNALHLKNMPIGTDFPTTSDCARANGLPPGASCTIQVVFKPQSAGAKSETLTVAGANSSSTPNVTVSGLGTVPVASLSATSIDFGPQALFTTSPSSSITLTNIGDADLIVNSVVPGLYFGDLFGVSHNCNTVAPGASCAIQVSFTPNIPGIFFGSLLINDDDINSPHQVSLNGQAIGPEIGYSDPILTFPPQRVGTLSAPLLTRIKNMGTADLVISSIVVTGDYSQTNDCPGTLAPGNSCQFSVTFRPTAYGNRSGGILLNDNAAFSPQSIYLNGYGSGPIAGWSPTALSFSGSTVVTTSSPSMNVSYSNSGITSLIVGSISVSGDFSQTNTCGSILLPGTMCNIAVRFTPTQGGTRTGSLTLVDDAAGSPHVISLTGEASATYPVPTLSGVSPALIASTNTNAVVTVTGANFFPGSIVYWDTTALPTTYVSATTLTVKPGALLGGLGDHVITISNPSPGGGLSSAGKVSVFISVPVSAHDLIYDPYRRVFYASIAGAATKYPNTIISIDPYTGQIGTPIPAGSEPNRLALSDDGQFLWVGLDGAHSLKRLNLYTNQFDLNIPLGTDLYFGAYSAMDLAAVPGAPHSVAVALATYPVSPAERGVKIYDDGVPRPVWGGGDYMSSIAFGSDSSTLFGSTTSTSPPYLTTLHIDANGVTPGASQRNAGGGQLSYRDNRLYTGKNAYDASTLTAVGAFTFVPSWVRTTYPEPGTGVIYLVEDVSDGTGQNSKIWVASTSTFTSTGNLPLPIPYAGISRLQRWGADGLAFRYYGGSNKYGGATANDQVVLVRSAITNPSTGNNPVPAIGSISPALASPGSTNFLLTINGINFVPGAVVRWNGFDRTTTFVSSTQLRAAIPSTDVSVAGTAAVTVVNPTPMGGESIAGTFLIGTGGSLTVKVPNGGETWNAGSTHTITWSNVGISGNVNLTLLKAGVGYQTIANGVPANQGSYTWIVPNSIPVGTDYSVRVMSATNSAIYDASNAKFSITLPPVYVMLTSPDGGEVWSPATTRTITWNSAGVTGDVNLTLLKGGVGYKAIATVPASQGSYSWMVPTSVAAGADYGIRIMSATDSTIYDASNRNFTVVLPTKAVTVTSPNGGQVWAAGTTRNITWTSIGMTGDVNLTLLRNNIGYRAIATVPVAQGNYTWTLPVDLPVASDYSVRIMSATDASIWDASDLKFSVAPQPVGVTVAAPNGGESWNVGSTQTITWTSNGMTGNVNITLLKAGVGYRAIATGVAVSPGTYSWTVPANLPAASDYTVRVMSATDGTLVDASNGSFSIAP